MSIKLVHIIALSHTYEFQVIHDFKFSTKSVQIFSFFHTYKFQVINNLGVSVEIVIDLAPYIRFSL